MPSRYFRELPLQFGRADSGCPGCSLNLVGLPAWYVRSSHATASSPRQHLLREMNCFRGRLGSQ